MSSANIPKIRKRLSELNILCVGRDIIYGLNKIKCHQKTKETFEHFIIKAAIGKCAMKLDDNIISEYELPTGGSIDILHIKQNSTIAYEIEGGPTRHYRDIEGVDQIDISLQKMPQDVKDAIKKLEDWATLWIV